MTKMILRYLFFGISWGSITFVINIIIGDHSMIPAAIIFILVGLAFWGSTIIYEFDRPSLKYQILIHLAIGLGTFLAIGFVVGWFSLGRPLELALNIGICIVMFGIVWTLSYLYDKIEVGKINKALKEQSHKRPSDTE